MKAKLLGLLAFVSLGFSLTAALLGIALALAMPTPATAASLISNGSFETGDFTDWTGGGNFVYPTFVFVTSGPFYVYPGAEDGTYYAALGPVGSPASLSQSFLDTPGQHLQLAYWLSANTDNFSEFTVSFDGKTLLDQVDPNTAAVWTLFTFNVTATGSDTIEFGFRDDGAFIALDNVSVTPVATPLPAALPLFATGFGALGLFGRRRKQRNTAAVA
jgi:hypothetical protein